MKDFKEVMSEKSTEDLRKVLEQKDDYQAEAVAAAETELDRREIISREYQIEIEDGADYVFLSNLAELSDNELLDVFKKEYTNLKFNEFRLLNKELEKRNIEPKEWFYISDGGSKSANYKTIEDYQTSFGQKSEADKKGPYTTSELKALANENEIRFNSYVKKEGLNYWIEAREIDGLLERKKWPKDKMEIVNLPVFKRKVTAGIVLAAIFSYLDFLYVGLQRIMYSGKASDVLVLLLVNSIFVFGSVTLRKWGFLTILIKSFLMAIGATMVVITEPMSDTPLLLGLALIDVLVIIILFANKKAFYGKPDIIGV